MPTDTHREESGHIESADGTKLAYQMTIPSKIVGTVLLVHGFAEHCGRYARIAQQLADFNFASLRFDYRGHGNSDGKRGHIFQFEDYLADFDAAYSTLNERLRPSIPPCVMAHSYGGLISLHAAQTHALSGMVLSSPFYGFAIRVPAWKSLAGKMLSKYIPSIALPTDIDPQSVSHDPATIAAYGTDPLIGRVASARWLTETEKAQRHLPDLAARIHVPILFQQAGDDKLVDAKAGREVFDAFSSTDKTWQDLPGQYHEIWFEIERDTTLGVVYEWLKDRIQPESSS